MKELLKKMEDRRKFLESEKKVDGHSFDPEERLGELQIWYLELAIALAEE